MKLPLCVYTTPPLILLMLAMFWANRPEAAGLLCACLFIVAGIDFTLLPMDRSRDPSVSAETEHSYTTNHFHYIANVSRIEEGTQQRFEHLDGTKLTITRVRRWN